MKSRDSDFLPTFKTLENEAWRIQRNVRRQNAYRCTIKLNTNTAVFKSVLQCHPNDTRASKASQAFSLNSSNLRIEYFIYISGTLVYRMDQKTSLMTNLSHFLSIYLYIILLINLIHKNLHMSAVLVSPIGKKGNFT